MRGRLVRLIAASVFATLVCGCVGVLDRCADGLNPPEGGWDRHGPA